MESWSRLTAQAVILVYDITNLSSFQNLEDWLSLARKHAKDIPVAIIANKSTLARRRAHAQLTWPTYEL